MEEQLGGRPRQGAGRRCGATAVQVRPRLHCRVVVAVARWRVADVEAQGEVHERRGGRGSRGLEELPNTARQLRARLSGQCRGGRGRGRARRRGRGLVTTAPPRRGGRGLEELLTRRAASARSPVGAEEAEHAGEHGALDPRGSTVGAEEAETRECPTSRTHDGASDGQGASRHGAARRREMGKRVAAEGGRWAW